jgi:hypothetical protein
LSAFMYIWLLFRIIRILLNDQRLLKKSQALLKDKLKRSIERTIDERLGNNILMQELGENKIELQYSLFDPERNSESHTKCNLKQRGIITDINLTNLKKIAQIIEESSHRKGFSFYENMLDLSEEDKNRDTSIITTKPALTNILKKNRERYLRKRFMDEITEESQFVLSFKKELIDDQSTLSEVSDLSNKAFYIKKKDDDTYSLRIELRNLKDQLIDDIRNERLGRISNLREVYISLSELFLDIMKSYSSNYTMAMARNERSNILGGWMEVQWLTDDLHDIYEIAMQSHRMNIIKEIGYLPFAIANRAIKALDHYIFQNSFGFLSMYYLYALSEPDKNLQAFMKNRCGMYLKETAEYTVQYELEKIELGEDRISQYRDFALEIFLQLQNLMKQSYDAKDIKSFQEFVSIGNNLFSRFHPSNDYLDCEHLQWQLSLKDLDLNERDKISKQLKNIEFLEKIEQDIKQKKSEMFFGLASFILSDYQMLMKPKEALTYFNVINSVLPSDLKELTAIFLKCHDFKVEDFWGWNWWILPQDEQVHTIDFLGKIVFLYCIKTLQVINTISEDELEKLDLSPNRDFVYMIEKEDSTIKKLIDNLLEESNQWSDIIPNGVSSKRNALFKIFERAKLKQEHDEEDSLINSKLSQTKVSEFISDFIESYKRSCVMHTIFEKYGDYQDQSKYEYTGKQKSIGYNRIDEKGAFIDEWYVSYSKWGGQYGSGMASSESSYLFNQICEWLTPINITTEDAINQIESATQMLINNKYSPNVIITSLDFDDYRSISSNVGFIPHWNKDSPKNITPNFQGILKLKYRELPVFRLYREKEKDVIGIFDLKDFASLVQLNPIDKEIESQYIREQFYIQIVDLNADNKIRKDIISAAPEWLVNYQDKERYLKTKVIVKTFLRQELHLKNKFAGMLLKIVSEQCE